MQQRALQTDRAENNMLGEATVTAVTHHQHVDLAGHIDEHRGGRSGRDHDVHRYRHGVVGQRVLEAMFRTFASTSSSIAGSDADSG